MGLTSSKPEEQPKQDEKLENIRKLFNKEQDTDDILESLNITEFKQETKDQVDAKKPIPMLGGTSMYGGNDDKDETEAGNHRYTKYDLFRILKQMDSDFQKGGNDENDVESSLNDEKSMEHIKNIILKELDNLKKSKAQHLGGSKCGCDSTKVNSSKLNLKNVEIDNEYQAGGNIVIDDSSSTSSSSSSSSSSEAGKKTKPSKKSSKSSKKLQAVEQDSEPSDSSKFFIETSESGNGENFNFTSNGEESEYGKKKLSKLGKSGKSNKSNKSKSRKQKEESEKPASETPNFDSADSEGLSIFPFNSSDVKSSSVSAKNYRMLRRKI